MRTKKPSKKSTPSALEKIRLEGIEKSFGTKNVLTGVDLVLNQGESLVVIGGSGSGKSVLLKCILGLLKPTGGKVFIDGKDLSSLKNHNRDEILGQIGMLFQGGALFDSLRVWENVIFGLRQTQKISTLDARKIALEKLMAVGLSNEVADLMPAELSGGMQKRVGLARAIAMNPNILFFDEPTTGLDPIMRTAIDSLIVKCVKDLGAAAITITHDLISARSIADKVAMLYEGKIIWTGSVKEIENSGNPYLDQFIHGRMEGPIPVNVKQ